MQQALFYATNRMHKGRKGRPTSYSKVFSADGLENLRFGKVSFPESKDLESNARIADMSGSGLNDFFVDLAEEARIDVYPERLDARSSDTNQDSKALWGSKSMFDELHACMLRGCDVLVFIHGFNVSWKEAVGSAMAVKTLLNRQAATPVEVVLFTWPSNGMALPYLSYKSDRKDADASGASFGRAFLKLRDFLVRLRQGRDDLCNQDFHLMCHSMGNYVLQQSLQKIADFTPGIALPRIFENVFCFAADVDDDVLEPDKPLGRLHEITRRAVVYFNKRDLAMYVSDYTKGNPERLGTHGAARLSHVHSKIEQVDCRLSASGLVQHSYYLEDAVIDDVVRCIQEEGNDEDGRRRERRIKV